ncbi:hypothetical protein [Solwaraspora sp. WMMD937]|uniref:hypothetical protein n=1 Tax=Solwaraspora sp. WMMD937 TaxID=3016090 RepID=UPI0032B4F091
MTPARRAELPVRFVDAQEINPFELLLNLHGHAVAWTPGSGRDDVLAELALSAAVVSRWTSWQPLMIHAALRAGADPVDIAEATGLEVDEVVRRWRRWADVQTRLDIGGRSAVDPVEVRAIEHRLGPGVVR